MANNIHILQRLDVLRSFEVAKFIPDSELKKIRAELKTLPKREREAAFDKKMEDIAEAAKQHDTMPGLITPQIQAKRTENLLRYSIKLAKDIQEMGLSKSEQSFIIVSLVKLLELKLNNFKNWKQSQKEDEDDDDEQEEDDRDED